MLVEKLLVAKVFIRALVNSRFVKGEDSTISVVKGVVSIVVLTPILRVMFIEGPASPIPSLVA